MLRLNFFPATISSLLPVVAYFKKLAFLNNLSFLNFLKLLWNFSACYINTDWFFKFFKLFRSFYVYFFRNTPHRLHFCFVKFLEVLFYIKIHTCWTFLQIFSALLDFFHKTLSFFTTGCIFFKKNSSFFKPSSFFYKNTPQTELW